jgi:hypothetical protein
LATASGTANSASSPDRYCRGVPERQPESEFSIEFVGGPQQRRPRDGVLLEDRRRHGRDVDRRHRSRTTLPVRTGGVTIARVGDDLHRRSGDSTGNVHAGRGDRLGVKIWDEELSVTDRDC